LFAQGISDYAPLRRDRRKRLEGLRTADGRPLPRHLKNQIDRERNEEWSRPVEPSRRKRNPGAVASRDDRM
jgi:hypothetical protein